MPGFQQDSNHLMLPKHDVLEAKGPQYQLWPIQQGPHRGGQGGGLDNMLGAGTGRNKHFHLNAC